MRADVVWVDADDPAGDSVGEFVTLSRRQDPHDGLVHQLMLAEPAEPKAELHLPMMEGVQDLVELAADMEDMTPDLGKVSAWIHSSLDVCGCRDRNRAPLCLALPCAQSDMDRENDPPECGCDCRAT